MPSTETRRCESSATSAPPPTAFANCAVVSRWTTSRAVVGGVWLPIGFRGLYAVFAAGFLPLMLTIVSEQGGTEGRGRSVGFFNSAAAVGTTIAQVAAGALLGLLVPSDLFLVIAGVVLVTLVAVVFVDDPTGTEAAERSASELRAEIRRRLVPVDGDRGPLRANGLPWLYAGLALRGATVLGVLSLMPIYLVESVGVSEFVMGVLLAINPAGQSVLMYSFGVTADRFGRKTLVVTGMAGSGAFAVVAAGAAPFGGERLGVVIVAAAFLLGDVLGDADRGHRVRRRRRAGEPRVGADGAALDREGDGRHRGAGPAGRAGDGHELPRRVRRREPARGHRCGTRRARLGGTRQGRALLPVSPRHGTVDVAPGADCFPPARRV